jgi:renalase
MKKIKIAIIGAGISGITLAKELEDIAQVKIFEKSRGVGGRMSTRYVEDFAFDHGTQCFSARTKNFQKFLAPFI